jgi:DNA-binding transcriptional MerR regulator
VSSYTIGEVAERSGFSASALRYYEGIGLVAPASRTDAGYRVYDDQTLARLGFIARAKQLGCSLEEITDLVSIWDGERCGPVQRRFHDLVTEKITGAHHQVAELLAFTAQLQAAAAQLAGPVIDGPCSDGCACVAGPPAVPIACTLEVSAMPQRLVEWQEVLRHTTARVSLGPGSLRIELDAGVAVSELARLAVEEQRCCSFFSFAVTADERGIGLEVRAPAEADDIVTSLFGAAA